MKKRKKLPRISINSPAVLGFVLICVIAFVLNLLTFGKSNVILFSVYRSSWANPLTYLRCITHVFGHAGWSHLVGNMMYILLLGPMLEEKYGSKNMISVFLLTAAVTGLCSILLFHRVMLLGASGVVFAMILLSSITATEEHTIPLTFILVALLYIGQQLYEGIFVSDNVSQITHIIGGAVGSVFGFRMKRKR